MSFQVLRIEHYTKGSLYGIGGETERTRDEQPNQAIDEERTPFNYYLKKSDGGLNAEWKKNMNNLGATFKGNKKMTAFDGMIITSDREFFEKQLGFVRGEPINPKVKAFFDTVYKFVLSEIGYHGTDANILSAVVHLDETTPHLQLYFIPLVDEGKRKVYERDASGKVVKVPSKDGKTMYPKQAKDENGKGLYERVKLEHPNVCVSDFWEQRGGKNAFGELQDRFYEDISIWYGLERGEKGSNKKHRTKAQWEREKLEEEKAALEKKVQEQQDQIAKTNEYLTEIRQAAEDAKSGKKAGLFGKDKQIEGLTLENKELTKKIASRDRDNELLFNDMRRAEHERDQLKPAADRYNFVKKNAPEALQEAERRADINARRGEIRSPNNNRSGWNSR